MKWNSHLFSLCLYLDGMLQSQRCGWEFNKYLRFWNDNSNIFVWWPTVNSIFEDSPIFSLSVMLSSYCYSFLLVHDEISGLRIENMNSVASLWNVTLLHANICADPFTAQPPRVTSYFQEDITITKWEPSALLLLRNLLGKGFLKHLFEIPKQPCVSTIIVPLWN